MLANVVISSISQAFANVRRPALDKIVSRLDWEADQLLAMLRRQKTEEIPVHEISYFKNSLPAFTPEGLLYALPQYLLYSVQHLESDVTDYVLYRLVNLPIDADFFESFSCLVTQGQRKAICNYLGYLGQVHPERDIMQTEIESARAIWCS